MHPLPGLGLLDGEVSSAEPVRDAGEDVRHQGGAVRVEHVTLAQLVSSPGPGQWDEAKIAGLVNKTTTARYLRIDIPFDKILKPTLELSSPSPNKSQVKGQKKRKKRKKKGLGLTL